MNNKFVVYCEPCGFRQLSETQEFLSLTKILVSPVAAGIPVADKAKDKVKVKKNPDIVSSPKVKCPNCGRGVVVRKIAVKGVKDGK